MKLLCILNTIYQPPPVVFNELGAAALLRLENGLKQQQQQPLFYRSDSP